MCKLPYNCVWAFFPPHLSFLVVWRTQDLAENGYRLLSSLDAGQAAMQSWALVCCTFAKRVSNCNCIYLSLLVIKLGKSHGIPCWRFLFWSNLPQIQNGKFAECAEIKSNCAYNGCCFILLRRPFLTQKQKNFQSCHKWSIDN